jgi:hypothetical protein
MGRRDAPPSVLQPRWILEISQVMTTALQRRLDVTDQRYNDHNSDRSKIQSTMIRFMIR